MRQSPKLEQDNGGIWEYADANSSRHGQFGFLRIWSDRDRFDGNGAFVPFAWRKLRRCPEGSQ
jgi:hypothetical protein